MSLASASFCFLFTSTFLRTFLLFAEADDSEGTRNKSSRRRSKEEEARREDDGEEGRIYQKEGRRYSKGIFEGQE
jgi:hypothetical protein